MLKIGTDCSGIEAPIQALEKLNICYNHVFSSEINKFCIKSIKANYKPDIIFGDNEGPYPEGDIRKRDIKEVPEIDLYVCGFPCQPFSIAGKRFGLEDNRGNVFYSCLDIIKQKNPKYFILENVKGICNHDKGNTWKIIEKNLIELQDYGYNVKWKILNTKDYGIPQNRERLYIVGSKDKKFEWPEDYIDNDDNSIDNIRNDVLKSGMLNKVPKDAVFIDFSFKNHNYPNSNKYSPCITADSRLWCFPKNRYANIKERLLLQGFNNNFKQVVSKTQLKYQIGNSMSVNILCAIFKNLIS